MNYLRYALIAVGLLFASQADAATCFWVLGTGSWSTSNTASWASSSGGTTGTCAATGGVPKNAGDIATFDGSSGGGTVTVDSTINGITIAQITMGAFTGTLDFSVNNPSITLSTAFSISGSGTRTLNLGSGTFTLTAGSGTVMDLTTTTGLTFNANTSKIVFAPTTINGTVNWQTGGKTYATVTFGPIVAYTASKQSGFSVTGSATIATLSVNPSGQPLQIRLSSLTLTVTNGLSWTGTSTSPIMLQDNSASGSAISSANASSCSWCVFQGMIFNGGGAMTASNSLSLGGNTGATINPPTTSGGHIIGG